jgi:integrase
MLTDKALRALKPRERPYKRADDMGLYVIVRPDGAVWWRFKYRHGGREKLISFGTYPDVKLKRAREKRDEARRLLDAGVDPSAKRRAEREASADSFEAIAREWLERQQTGLSASTLESAKARLEQWAFPSLGSTPVRAVEPPDVLRTLRKIEALGKHETAHRVRQRISQVFRYAIATGRATRDPTADLRGALAPVPTENRPAVTDPKGVAALLRAIDGYQGQPAVMYALRLAPLVFVRPGELRAAVWTEFTLDGAEPEWRIPAERMKMGERHIVPLSVQAVALLGDLKMHTGRTRYLFPSLRTTNRPISDNALNAALRRLGYSSEEMVSHGFRTIASTLLNELGFHPDLIELQLAHKPRDKVRAAYNKAERLSERRKLMQTWADHLDGLKAAAT